MFAHCDTQKTEILGTECQSPAQIPALPISPCYPFPSFPATSSPKLLLATQAQLLFDLTHLGTSALCVFRISSLQRQREKVERDAHRRFQRGNGQALLMAESRYPCINAAQQLGLERAALHLPSWFWSCPPESPGGAVSVWSSGRAHGCSCHPPAQR